MIVRSQFARGRNDRHGVAAMEMLVVLPFLLLILFGVWEIGRLVHVSQIVSNSAREGGRLAATGNFSASGGSLDLSGYQIQVAVGNYLQNAGLPLDGASVTVNVTNVTRGISSSATIQLSSPDSTYVTVSSGATSIDPVLTAEQYDYILVEVSYPFNFARWMPVNPVFSLSENTSIYAAAQWPCMRDKPVAIDATIPSSPLR